MKQAVRSERRRVRGFVHPVAHGVRHGNGHGAHARDLPLPGSGAHPASPRLYGDPCDPPAPCAHAGRTQFRAHKKRRIMRNIGNTGHPARGFTLIELLIAITILAVVAVLAWRGLDEVIRARNKVNAAMADERAFAQTFEQMRTDARLAATDDEAGEPAVRVEGNTLQIVRGFDVPGAAPRLQVVRYVISGGVLERRASPPVASFAALRATLHDDASSWNAVPLMRGIGSISARLYVPRTGWTTRMADAEQSQLQDDKKAAQPLAGSAPSIIVTPVNAPLPRVVTGLEVGIGATSLHTPVKRVFLVGQ